VDISHTPLWSAKAVLEQPGSIIEAHLAFLRAGARVILTPTYQCSFQTFGRAGYSEAAAQAAMLKAVRLSNEARTTFANKAVGASGLGIKIALSLGPFGACLTPPQEFDGYYPPPYGPKENSGDGSDCNAFGRDTTAEMASIDMLAHFHSERLLVFARDSETWKTIDCIAFETVPLVREVKAIKLAMLRLQQDLVTRDSNAVLKPWWISGIFPGGHCPETQCQGGPNLTATDFVTAALQWSPCLSKELTNMDSVLPVPAGVGINCTSMDFIPVIVAEMTRAVTDFHKQALQKPWLVLYPNGGDVYDPTTRTWQKQKQSEKETWAFRLGKIVSDVTTSHMGVQVWGGIMVGGCCRTGPEEIRVLAEVLHNP